MDPTRWPHAPNALALARQGSDDLHEVQGRIRMKLIAGLLIAAALAFASGCAKTDWIDRTLVTVDVTGTWEGKAASVGAAMGATDLLFELEQQGSTVKGLVRVTGRSGGPVPIAGPIEGTVAGDVFRFRTTRGVEGELTVSGDEMNGRVSLLGSQPLSLRRVDPSSRPGSPPR